MSKNDLMNDKPLKISELARYVIDRYDLLPTIIPGEREKVDIVNSGEEKYSESESARIYEQALTRIMQKVKVQVGTTIDGIPDSPPQEQPLWDVLKQVGKARQISIKRFYLYCFDSLEKYLVKNIGEDNFDCAQLEKDREAVQDLRLAERAKLLALAPVDHRFSISDKELREQIIYMMVKALFTRDFTPIDEAKLRADMEYAAYGVDEDNPTDEDIRLHAGIYDHPEGVYYHRLDK